MKIYNKDNLNDNVLFRKEPGTRKKNIVYNFTAEELKEYSKCSNDSIYFIEKYLQIKLREYQKDWIKKFEKNKYNIFTGSRQMGRNSTIALVCLHKLLFEVDFNILLVDCKIKNATEIFSKIFDNYKKVPFFMKKGIIKKESKEIYLDNNNNFSFLSYDKRSISSGYSKNYDIVWLNDFYTKEMETIYKDIINISDNIIITASFRGNNLLNKLITDGELPEGHPSKNIFVVTRNYWYEVEGRDEKWKQEQIKILGKDLWDLEYDGKFKV